jgi:PAS domain S-box-containing protein
MPTKIDLQNENAALRLRVAQLEANRAAVAYPTNTFGLEKVENALQQSEERYRGLFENMLNGLAYCKILYENNLPVDFCFLNVNAQFEHLTGLKNVIGKKVSQVIPGIHQDNPDQLEIYARVAATGQSESFETHLLAFDTWYSVSVYCPEKGTFVALFENITTRKQVEERLRQSEKRFSVAFHANPAALLITRLADGQIVDVNEAYCRMSEADRSDIIGHKVSELKLWVDEDQYQVLLDQIRASSHIHEMEMRFRTFTGQVRTMLTSTEMIDLYGEKCLVSFALDITERKRNQEAMHLKDSLLNMTGEMVKVGGWEFDPHTRKTTWTDEIARIYDTDPQPEHDVSLGLSFYQGESRKIMETAIQAAITHAVPYDLELELISAKGIHKWVHTKGIPVTENGEVVKIRGIFQDITEHKLAEEKIKTTLEEKETLLREVHHRVKNNLQAIIALMQMQAGQIQDSDTRWFLKKIEGQAFTMSLIYEQLYQSENLAHVAMAPYIQRLTSNILETFINHSDIIQLKLDIDPMDMEVTQAMPCGLIINELVTNILKHAFPPEYAGMPSIQITLHKKDRAYHLSIRDNGVGMPANPNGPTNQGLGMRLVNLWVTHQLGGSLKITGGPGTCFSIRFDPSELKGEDGSI